MWSKNLCSTKYEIRLDYKERRLYGCGGPISFFYLVPIHTLETKHKSTHPWGAKVLTCKVFDFPLNEGGWHPRRPHNVTLINVVKKHLAKYANDIKNRGRPPTFQGSSLIIIMRFDKRTMWNMNVWANLAEGHDMDITQKTTCQTHSAQKLHTPTAFWGECSVVGYWVVGYWVGWEDIHFVKCIHSSNGACVGVWFRLPWSGHAFAVGLTTYLNVGIVYRESI